ncbi:MAG TPA: universal stress protein [Phycisphaerae bacterium]|nr:universal stress protein [Phycisphaerae bacterium]HRW52605.1 universal stress protein [Phycisphaerae bacterium]
MISLKRILLPTDFSEFSLPALKYARSFAESYGAELHILHVVDEASLYWMAMGPNSLPIGPCTEELMEVARKEMSDFIAQNLADAKGVKSEVVMGRPFSEIIRYARESDVELIVLCTHGRSGIQHALLGSVTEKVVRKAPCPVLTVRHPEHDFVMP